MALLYLLKTRKFKSRLMRWALKLKEYDFYAEHIHGNLNFSDILSRAFKIQEVLVTKGNRNLIVPLKGDEKIILKDVHESTGHGGTSTMKYHILRKYIWKHVNSDINNYVKGCEVCARELIRKKEEICRI